MFTGAIKDRNVSGLLKRNTGTSKDSFLEETRKKREERAIQKAKDNACIKIQSHYRSYNSRLKLKNSVKGEFEKKITDIKKIKSIFLIKSVSFIVPTDALITIFRLYLVSLKSSKINDRFYCNLFDSIQNVESFVYIQSLLLESLNAIEQHNIMSYCCNLLTDCNQNNSWHEILLTNSKALILTSILFQLRDILKLTVLYLEHYFTNRRNIVSIDESINLLRAILSLITSSSYNSQKKLLLTISYLLVPIFCKSLKNLIENTFALSEEEKSRKLVYVNVLIDYIITALRVPDESLKLFSSHRLSYNCWYSISNSLLTVSNFTEATMLSRLCVYLNTNNCEGWLTAYDVMSASSTETLNTTTNTFSSNKGPQISKPISSDQVSFLVNFFNTVLMSPQICTSIISLQGHGTIFLNNFQNFLHQVPLLAAMRSIELDSIQTTFERVSGFTAASEFKILTLQDMNARQVRLWDTFHPHVQGLHNIFKNFLLSNSCIPIFFDNVTAVGMAKSNVLSVFQIITIYSDILMACPLSIEQIIPNSTSKRLSISKSILNSLAFSRPSHPLPKRLWEFLKTCGLESLDESIQSLIDNNYGSCLGNSCQAVRKLSVDVNIDVSILKEGLCNSFYILCIVMSHQLTAIDDEEFFEEQQVMQLEDIKCLIDLLKKCLQKMYLTNPIFEMNDNSELKLVRASLLEAMTILFNGLYSRHERRAFLSEEAWKWNNLNINDFAIIENSVSSDDTVLTSHQFRNANVTTILKDLPQVIPFKLRVTIFHDLLAEDKKRFGSQFDAFFNNGTRISVKRDNIVHDAYQALQNIDAAHLKRRLQIEFVSETGLQEAGIDGGGLYKAFMDSFAKAAFDVGLGFFQPTSAELLFPNPASSLLGDHHLHYFNFLGKMLGKALYDNVIVEPQFSGVFLNVLLGRLNQIDDVWYLDETLHHNLMSLKKSSAQEIADLGLTFEIQSYHFGESVTKELIPNGTIVPVTKENIHSYIHRYANYKLNVEVAEQCRAFMSGFRSMLPVSWIQMFSPKELQLLLSGDPKPIDIEDMRKHVNYGNGYHDSQPYIDLFWEVVSEMTVQEQSKLLFFATSCPRLPLLGAKSLYPKFCVYRIPPPHNHRLPSAATCMNLLKLPQYDTKEMLKEKLLYAITSNSGFELS